MKTQTVKRILIALDYDPAAQKVAEAGYSYGKAMGAEIILLHIISDPVYYSSTEYSPIMGFTGFPATGPYEFDSGAELQKAAQHFLDKSKHHLGDNAIITQVRDNKGDFAETILKTAKELHADIIVMGSHGRRWLDEILMGSVTEQVLHNTSLPLIIIPTKKHK